MGLAVLVRLIGVVVPLTPGLLLVWAAVLVWACTVQAQTGLVIFGIAMALALSGFLMECLLAGRRLAKAGITMSSTLAGAALGSTAE